MAERDSNDTARAERGAAARLDATAPPDLDLAGKLTPARPRSDAKAAERPASEAPQATAPEADTAAKPAADGPQETEKAQAESAQAPASEPGPELSEAREPRLSMSREPVRLDHLSTVAPSPGRPASSRGPARSPRRSPAARPYAPLRSDRVRGTDWPDPADPERRRRAVMWRMGALAAVIVIAGAATIAFQLGSLYEPPQRVAVSGMASLAALPEMPADSDAAASQRMSVVNKSRAPQNQQAAAGAPPPTSDVAPQGSAGTVPLPTGQAELPPAVRPGEPLPTPAPEPARSAEAAAAESEETVNAPDEIAAIIEETAPAAGEETAPAVGEEATPEPVEATGSVGDVQPASDETAASEEMPTITAASDDGGSQAGAEPAQVTTDVNLRSGPANEAEPIVVIPGGSEVTVWGCDYWCEVSFGGRRGYVYRDFVQPRGA